MIPAISSANFVPKPGISLESDMLKSMQRRQELHADRKNDHYWNQPSVTVQPSFTTAQISRSAFGSAFRSADLLPFPDIGDYPGEKIGVSLSKMMGTIGARYSYKGREEGHKTVLEKRIDRETQKRLADWNHADTYSGIASLFHGEDN